ncbi:MAG: site-specific DNA-methyltransferase [Candidatus Gastranaerophilales bacterium]
MELNNNFQDEQIKKLFPECFNDGNLDFDAFIEALSDKCEEKYGFEWQGKSECVKLANEQTSARLKFCQEKSVDFETTKNLYIDGDNLCVMKLLLKDYENKIKMVYIDPPYNTGKDFVYNDNFRESRRELKSEQKKETSALRHTKWLNMMFPRLIVARKLLSENGVIFISIGDFEVVNLRKLCDDVFGEENFVEMFSWVRTNTPVGLSPKSRKTNEYVLCYEKNKNSNKYNAELQDGGDQPMLNSASTVKTLKFPVGTVEFTRKFKLEEVKACKLEKVEILNGFRIVNGKNHEEVALSARFKWNQKYLDNEIANGTKFVVKNEKFLMRFLKAQIDYKRPNNFIKDEIISPLIDKKTCDVDTNEVGTKELVSILGGNYFDYPKPTSLIKYLMRFVMENDDIVLDFFSGSATTADACFQLNNDDGGSRKFILVQLPESFDITSDAYKAGFENICELGRKRILHSGDRFRQENSSIDVGFKTFKLEL